MSLANKILVMMLAVAVAFASGWLYGRSQLARAHQLDKVEALAVAEKTLREGLEEATRKGDVLSANLAKAEQTINELTLEKTHALLQTTTGRACFSAATVGVLNRSLAATLLPQASGASDAAGRGAPADSGDAEASDTDIAGWINHAIGQFDTCRARLGALIDFEEQRP